MILPEFLDEWPGGEIKLAGHRIPLHTFIRLYNCGYSAEMLAEEFDTLSLPHIHKTIAYYLENKPEVDSYCHAHRTEMDRLEAETPPGTTLAELRRRAAARQLSKTA